MRSRKRRLHWQFDGAVFDTTGPEDHVEFHLSTVHDSKIDYKLPSSTWRYIVNNRMPIYYTLIDLPKGFFVCNATSRQKRNLIDKSKLIDVSPLEGAYKGHDTVILSPVVQVFTISGNESISGQVSEYFKRLVPAYS